jgi:hypothetical protein
LNKDFVLGELRSFVTAVPAQDALVLFFAGHGVSKGEHFYLCTTDTDLHDLPRTAINDEELDEILQDCHARGVLLILDCCFGAAFAETAPGFFRTLGKSDFRILLSSSRSEQRSWERPGGGTLFSQHLKEVMCGATASSGIVCFSDLFAYIQEQLAEDIEAIPGTPHQEPIFAGVYAKDPVLFVHKSLTLKQIAVQTTRYSKAYVRRLLRRTLIVAAIVVGFGFGTYYTVLEHYQYLEVAPEGLSTYTGYPGRNAFGFPRLQWVYDLSGNDLVSNSELAIRRTLPAIENCSPRSTIWRSSSLTWTNLSWRLTSCHLRWRLVWIDMVQKTRRLLV